jgi:Uma2 family endonuclease
MANATLVTVSEYLKTSYRPDVDLVDGELLERNMGERPHARMQGYFYSVFDRNELNWSLTPLPEQRVQVCADRFRVPDLCVVRTSDPADAIVVVPPMLCIEVLSSDDTLRGMKARVNDYAAMGVPNIWVVDPWKREAYYASAAGYDPVMDGVMRIAGTPVEVSLAEAFARLDA